MGKKIFSLIIFLLFLLLLNISFAADDTCSIVNNNCSKNTSQNYDTNPVLSENKDSICIVYFYGDGCSKCASLTPYIEGLEKKYGDKIHVTKYEIYHNIENYKLYNNFCNIQSIPLEERGIPFVAINDKYFMGLNHIKANLEPEIEDMLKTGKRICPLTGEMACHAINYTKTDTNPAIKDFKAKLSLPLVTVAAIVDSINPCAFAVLIFLLAFLLEVSNDKKRMLKAGLTYIIVIYITYFLSGIGLLSIIQFSGAARIVMMIAAIIAIIAGLINIKDYSFYGKWFSLEIPKSKKATIEKYVHKANIPAAIVLGFLVSMFELPCTGGPYLAIIAMLANTVTRTKAVFYLLYYNLLFILPLIIIVILVLKGMKTEHLENWRQKKKTWMKLALGILLVILGVVLLVYY